MKTKWMTLLVVLLYAASACSARETLNSPEEVVHNLLQACEAGDLAEVETYLTAKALQAYKNGWLPCETYLGNGLFTDGSEFEWVQPDLIEYREWDTAEHEDQTGEKSGYEGVLVVADLTWLIEGSTDPLGENTDPGANTTYITSFSLRMIKINGQWKLDCGWC